MAIVSVVNGDYVTEDQAHRAIDLHGPVLAELRCNMIGQDPGDARRALNASGIRLGRPVELPVEARSRRAIASDLDGGGVVTARGGQWHASTVRRFLDSFEIDGAYA